MTDHVTRFVEAMDRKDAEGIRAALAPDVRLVAMAPDAFHVRDGADAAAEKLGEWYASWEEEPRFAFLSRLDDGDRSVVEFERASSFEGDAYVVRQAQVIRSGPEGIEEMRIYCTGPRTGAPDLAAAFGAAAA